jgi:hypothetical protein
VHGVLIDKSLKKQLDIDIGDFLYLGNIKIKINGIIEKEPDRMLSFATFGSRLLITNKALNESGLIIPGSLVKHKIKFIPSDKKINLSRLSQLIEGTNITIRGIKNSTNNFNNFIEKTSLFISLVGLIALLISGIGISNGVKGYLIKKIKNIAVLKSLGGRNSQVFTIYFFQIIIIFVITQFYSRSPGLTVRMVQLFVIGFFMIQITMASEEYETKKEKLLKSQLMALNTGGSWVPENQKYPEQTHYHLKFKCIGKDFDLIAEKNRDTSTEVKSVHKCKHNLNPNETKVICKPNSIYNTFYFSTCITIFFSN